MIHIQFILYQDYDDARTKSFSTVSLFLFFFFFPSKLKLWTNFKRNIFSIYSDTWCSIYFFFAENSLLGLSHMPQNRLSWSLHFFWAVIVGLSFTVFLEISFITLFHFGSPISCVPYSFFLTFPPSFWLSIFSSSLLRNSLWDSCLWPWMLENDFFSNLILTDGFSVVSNHNVF